MSSQQLFIGIIRFMHDLFTAVWVGGLALMVLTVLPSSKKVFGKGPQSQALINAITRRHRIWVYFSIAGLFITGLLLSKSEPGFMGFMRFDNLYSILTAIKHILTFVMVFFALFRSLYFGKKDIKLSPKLIKFSMLLIIVNFIFGLFVLLLSGLIASI